MRRHLIGIIALLLLLGGVLFRFYPPEGSWQAQLEASCWRAGSLAGVIWLAFEQLRRLPAWLFGALIATAVVVALKPKTILLAIPLIIALAILRPRIGRPK